MRALLLSVTAAGLLAAPAQAYTVKANVECTAVLKEDANATYRMANQWWVLGYLTARNYEADLDAGKGIDDEVIYQMLLEYCGANPGNDIDDASQAIFEALR